MPVLSPKSKKKAVPRQNIGFTPEDTLLLEEVFRMVQAGKILDLYVDYDPNDGKINGFIFSKKSQALALGKVMPAKDITLKELAAMRVK
jgi:hypothetical protein